MVELVCIKEKGKLRVRIISSGYFHDANVQFPRSIRKEGRHYFIPAEYITLITTRGKYYYSVKKEQFITITKEDNDEINNKENNQDEKEVIKNITNILKIHTDENNIDCCICMTNEKSIVFNPCGHYYSCTECSGKIEICPICRTKIINKISITEFG